MILWKVILLDMEIFSAAEMVNSAGYCDSYLKELVYRSDELDALKVQIQHRNLLLVIINPSYGASLICLCEDITIEPTWRSHFNRLFLG